MGFEVIWTPNASNDLANILEYLEGNWPSGVADNFLYHLRTRIHLISVFPEIGISFEDDETTRRILITKHNALYYEIDDRIIILLKIADTRSATYP